MRRPARTPVADQSQRGPSEAKPTAPRHGEHETDELGELQRRHGLPLGHGTEPRRDERGEDPAVGVPARTADGADGEHHGLHREDDGRRAPG